MTAALGATTRPGLHFWPENALELTLSLGDIRFNVGVTLSCDDDDVSSCGPEISTNSCSGCWSSDDLTSLANNPLGNGGQPSASGNGMPNSGSGSGSGMPNSGIGSGSEMPNFGSGSESGMPNSQQLTKVSVLVGLRLDGDRLEMRAVLGEGRPASLQLSVFFSGSHLETEERRGNAQEAVELAVTLVGPDVRLADILAFRKLCDHNPLQEAVQRCIASGSTAAFCRDEVDTTEHSCAGKLNEWQNSRWSEVDDALREEARVMQRFFGPSQPTLLELGSSSSSSSGSGSDGLWPVDPGPCTVDDSAGAECTCSGHAYCHDAFNPYSCQSCSDIGFRSTRSADDCEDTLDFLGYQRDPDRGPDAAAYEAASCRFYCFNVTTPGYDFADIDSSNNHTDCDGDVMGRQDLFTYCYEDNDHQNDICSCAKVHYYFLHSHQSCFDGNFWIQQYWDDFEINCRSSTAVAFTDGGGTDYGIGGAVGDPPVCCDPVDGWCDGDPEGEGVCIPNNATCPMLPPAFCLTGGCPFCLFLSFFWGGFFLIRRFASLRA